MWGMISLLVGSVGDFAVPLYIGWVIDDLNNKSFDNINLLCLELIGIVFVSVILFFVYFYTY